MAEDPPTAQFDDATETAVTRAHVGEAAERIDLPEAGYRVGELIGKGGMGEVIAARDLRIGRDVAIKRMRTVSPTNEQYARFWREARIQARLDHPAIVPVYELGYDADNRPFFTMKRLAGVTLAERQAQPKAPLKPMLRAFVEVCLAIDFAHSRGVLHRDLKPTNIMLGDYGEVYVLDWGVARMIGDAENHVPGGEAPLTLQTHGDSLLGTPGYMSPEQMRDPAMAGPPADVYSLGATLFELLAGEPLHPRGQGAVASTLERPTDSPARRAPDRRIPIDLDAVCMVALHAQPDRRPSVRELADRIQAYLDGEGDIERRRKRAQEHLAIARTTLDSGDADLRAEAIREAGRALVLDPSSQEAVQMLTSLLVEPPQELPRELVEMLAVSESDAAKKRARASGLAVASLLSMSVFLPFLRVKNWVPLIAIYLVLLTFMGVAFGTYRSGRPRVAAVFVGTIAMTVMMGQLAGPFMLVPSLMCGMVITLSGMPYLNERRWLIVLWVIAAAISPLAIEWLGFLPQTASVIDGKLGMTSAIFDTHGTIDLVALTTAHIAFLIITGVYIHSITRDRREAQRKLQIQAWHLQKLIPDRRKM